MCSRFQSSTVLLLLVLCATQSLAAKLFNLPSLGGVQEQTPKPQVEEEDRQTRQGFFQGGQNFQGVGQNFQGGGQNFQGGGQNFQGGGQNFLGTGQTIQGPITPAQYEFAYDVKVPEEGNDYGHAERRNGDITEGMYRVLLPDGRIQVVTYTVNGQSGYVATVSYQ